ncbi:FliM/FliN family flagellar motor C-terminal domain-containing protein [Burkholderia sp. BCC0044]|uniref:flagellar motor switch protein FliM n=1 Tax=Burkholderia sp. BCC0044 TaxID=2676295 RepID=UPI001588DD54|nr:FliM/FliN family flagellar motor C-terminal domain-containing protein [Burkholderia sp. BCC0044]
MSALSHSSHYVRTASPVVLDPCMLGRPYHLLGDVLQDIRRRIDHTFHERFNLRRGTQFVSTRIAISAIMPRDAAGWRTYVSSHGQIAVRCDRTLLLALLACHYDTPLDEATLAAPGPETGTERRFAAQHHTALLAAFAAVAIGDQVEPFSPSADTPPGPGARVLRVTIEDRPRQLAGDIEFALDDTWLDHLFARLDAQCPRPAPPAPDGAPPGVSIPVTLSVRMLSRDMLLDDLLRIAPGDVLPVRLPDTADVLVNDVRLYRAAVAEQRGALWITSFALVE